MYRGVECMGDGHMDGVGCMRLGCRGRVDT